MLVALLIPDASGGARAMNFSSKKRPRKDAWRELQKELDEREKVEEENSVKLKKVDALRSRVCLEEEPKAEARHAYFDIQIGRVMGKAPVVTRGRVVVELFDDIMPRTVEQFSALLQSDTEPMYRGSIISKIYPGFHCIAGERESRVEGASSSRSREAVFSRVESEANWQLPHLNPGILSLADAKSSRFNITFRKAEELDGWHAVFGKVVYGFDVLKVISEQGNINGEPKLPVSITGGGAVPRDTHPREYLKKLELPEDPEVTPRDDRTATR